MTERDPLKDVFDTHWTPETGTDDAFLAGLNTRKRYHRTRRFMLGTTATVLLVCSAVLFSPFTVVDRPPETVTATPTAPVEVAQHQTPPSDDYWGSALTNHDETQAIPEEYDALSSFFLGDS